VKFVLSAVVDDHKTAENCQVYYS